MAPTATRNLGRLSEIAQVAVRHGFGYFFERHRLTDLLPWGDRVPALEERSQRGVRVREMLDELGPTFVKFGQLLSMRPDVVPADIIAELRGLQDDVRPVPFAAARAVIEEELELELEKLFVEFEEQPIAAASIGQVHRAVLPTGEKVAVKVQRPDAPRQIEADLALLYQAARVIREAITAAGTGCMAAIDAERFLDNLPVPVLTGEEVTIEGEIVTADHEAIIMPDGEVISNHVESESEGASAGD